ncbi:PKD domain-containing protein [Candidatus Acetothermia bacterium]|nr:PKD domain-containing protein [Candidatus Acetothermia bacterium]MBI3642505.1 PKD domain-containing protein [Candidatus Acetothermia bacterium]
MHQTSSTSQLSRSAKGLLGAILLGTKSADNIDFTFTRSAPDSVQPNASFTVTDSLVAKVDLGVAAIVPVVTPGFTRVSGDERAFKVNVSAGDKIDLVYVLKAPNEEGDYTLTSNAAAKAGTSDSVRSSVDISITVSTQAAPPTTPPPTTPPPTTPPPTTPENKPPVASFSFSPQTPRVGNTITFDGSGSSDADGTVADYSWDFGDGGNSQGQAIVTHQYAKAGTYQVSLIVKDDKGASSDSVKLSVSVSTPPSTIFGLPASTVLIGVGVVVGLVAIYFLIQEFGGSGQSISALTMSDSLAGTVQADVHQFLLSTGLPVSSVSDIKVTESIDDLNHARWALDLSNQSLIVFYSGDKDFMVKQYRELSMDESTKIDLSQLGTSSLFEFVSEHIARGDTVLSLTWNTVAGKSFQSLAVVGPDGKVKFDTLMSLISLAVTETPPNP